MRIKKSEETPVKLGCLGKVKTGEKHEKGYPMSLDYFRFDSQIEARNEKLKAMFGDKPKSINITFYSNDQNEVCSQRLELRDKGGRLISYGDGELFRISTANGWEEISTVNEENKARIKELQTKYSTKEYKAVWRETLILRFLIIGFPEIGYWELRTYGKETAIPQITSVFDWCLDKFQRVMMIPFTLTVGKHKSNRAEVNRNYSVIQLFCNVGVDAIEAVRDWNGVGLLSGDKLMDSKKIEAKSVLDVVNLSASEEVIEFEELKEYGDIDEVVGFQDDEIEEAKAALLEEAEENLKLMKDDYEKIAYFNNLRKHFGKEYLDSIDGFNKLFESVIPF